MLKIKPLFENVLIAMRAYYVTLAALINIFGIGQIKNYGQGFKPAYIGIAAIFNNMDYRYALLISSLVLIVACFIAALKISWRWPRIFVFLSLLLFAAVMNSTGGATHLYQFWLWSSFVLAWAPSCSETCSRHAQMRYLLSWWGAQSIVLLMYGLSGFWKVIGGIVQLYNHQTHILAPKGLSYHLASEIIRTGSNPLFGPWLLAHENWQPAMSLAVIVLQLSCLVGIFKLQWRFYIGLALIAFHFSTYFFLAINYPTNFALIAILFLIVPIKKKNDLSQFLKIISQPIKSSRTGF